MSHISHKQGVWIGRMIMLIVLAASYPVSAQTTDWTTLPDNYQDLIRYRSTTQTDTLNYSGYQTKYEIQNQYSFSISATITINFIDGDALPDTQTIVWHLGPDVSGFSVIDANGFTSLVMDDIDFHTSDPIPQ